MKPDKTGHPLYTTSPDCNGLFTGSVWLGLVFFRATGKNQSLSVGSGQNQSEPDAEKQTCDRLVRPDLMYQTERKMSLVFAFGIAFWYCFLVSTGVLPRCPHVGPCRGLLAGMATWSDWPGKPATGRTWGSRGREKATHHQRAARCGTMKGARILG